MKPADLMHRCRDTAAALEMLTLLCSPAEGYAPSQAISAADIAPLLGILTGTMAQHVNALDAAIAAQKPVPPRRGMGPALRVV